jgi:intracellular sulfur oxidation DsrE/DsrF family protein
MATKVLKIVARNEHCDPMPWLCACLKGSASLDVLLRGSATRYLRREPEGEAADLVRRGVGVFYLREDVAARGITQSELIEGAQAIAHAALPTMLSAYDQIWHW